MKKIGITGQNGFIGSHLLNTLKLYPEEFALVDFRSEYFDDPKKLDGFVGQCDVIVHLAALNRHESEKVIYETNIKLAQQLKDSLLRTNSKAHILISSSTQEERDNLYGKSKKKARTILAEWAHETDGIFTGLVIPNVFGAFGKPFYNSFIATFCYQLTHGETPVIQTDGVVKLIYVQELVDCIIKKIRKREAHDELWIDHTSENKVSEVLAFLESYKSTYLEKGEIPELKSVFERNLFNTYRSYIDHQNYFPVKFKQHTDDRGSFVEIIRLGIGGQVSFSTTKPGITRGDHFHTRKIERFAVIKGKALIQLRKIGTNEILNFELDGNEPAYVDMPVWYTHNIKNIGDEVVYTNFWINEPYDPDDADTYFENV